MAIAIETRARVGMNSFDDTFRLLNSLHRLTFYMGEESAIAPTQEDLSALYMLNQHFLLILNEKWEGFTEVLHKEVFPIVADMDRAKEGKL
jgi:hypothetical protein